LKLTPPNAMKLAIYSTCEDWKHHTASHCHDTCDVNVCDKRNRQQAPAGIHVTVPCLEHETAKLEFDSAFIYL